MSLGVIPLAGQPFPSPCSGFTYISHTFSILVCISALLNAAFALRRVDARPPPSPSLSFLLSNKSSCLIPPRAQGVLLFKAQSVFPPFHPPEEAELTSADPQGRSPSPLQPASHSFSRSLIHCSFFFLKSKLLQYSPLFSLCYSGSDSSNSRKLWEKSRGAAFTPTLITPDFHPPPRDECLYLSAN